MTRLNDIVKSFEDLMHKIPQINQDGWNYPINLDSLDEVLKKFTPDFLNNMKKTFFINEKINEIDKKDISSLAIKSYHHDLNNILGCVSGYLNMVNLSIELGITDSSAIINEINTFLVSSTQSKLFGLTFKVLAEDKPMDDIEFPLSDCKFLFPRFNVKKFEIGDEIRDYKIFPAEFFIIYQFLSNAYGEITINFSKDEQNIVLSVADSGKGLLDKEGKSLSKDRIYEIFNEFSTKKGGFGLQGCKKIAELYGHNIEVKTTTDGNPTLKYSLKDGNTSIVTPREKIGSTFSLIKYG